LGESDESQDPLTGEGRRPPSSVPFGTKGTTNTREENFIGMRNGLHRRTRRVSCAHIMNRVSGERWAQSRPILENSIRMLYPNGSGGCVVTEIRRGERIINWKLGCRGLQASWADRRARFDTLQEGAQVGTICGVQNIPNKFWAGCAGCFNLINA